MPFEQTHPSDQLLLQYADGELSPRNAAYVRGHLETCLNCRSQMTAIESTIAELAEIRDETLDPTLPPIEGPGALLKARVAHEANQLQPRPWWQFRNAFIGPRLAYATALGFVILLTGRTIYLRACRDNYVARYVSILPDPTLTPGATRPVAVADICSSSHEEVVSPVSATVRQAVFKEYGIRGTPEENYEVDYLITPGLGGSDDIRNLWPQPRFDTTWNSFVKDELEDDLHQSVCRGDVKLETAQHEVAANWISAYKKHFRTNIPLAHNTSLNLFPVGTGHSMS
jgi:hypothetical protein